MSGTDIALQNTLSNRISRRGASSRWSVAPPPRIAPSYYEGVSKLREDGSTVPSSGAAFDSGLVTLPVPAPTPRTRFSPAAHRGRRTRYLNTIPQQYRLWLDSRPVRRRQAVSTYAVPAKVGIVRATSLHRCSQGQSWRDA